MDGPEKWRILRLHVEDDIALTTLAQDTGLGLPCAPSRRSSGSAGQYLLTAT